MSLFELILLFSVLINIYLLFKWVSSKKEIKPLKKEVEVALNDVDLEKNN